MHVVNRMKRCRPMTLIAKNNSRIVKEGAMVVASASLTIAVGKASLDTEALFRMVVDGQAVLWIHSLAKDLQVRLIVCAHMKQAAHRGVA